MSRNTVFGVTEGRAEAEKRRSAAEEPREGTDEPARRDETEVSATTGGDSSDARAPAQDSLEARVLAGGEEAATVKSVTWAATLLGVPATAFNDGANAASRAPERRGAVEASSVGLSAARHGGEGHDPVATVSDGANPERSRAVVFHDESPDLDDAHDEAEAPGTGASHRPFIRSLGLGTGGAFVLGLAVVGLIRIAPQDPVGPPSASGVSSWPAVAPQPVNPRSDSIGTVVPTTPAAPIRPLGNDVARDPDGQSLAAGSTSPGAATATGAPAAMNRVVDEDAPPADSPSEDSPSRAGDSQRTSETATRETATRETAARETAPRGVPTRDRMTGSTLATEIGGAKRGVAATPTPGPGLGANHKPISGVDPAAAKTARKVGDVPALVRAGEVTSSAPRREGGPALSPPPQISLPRSPPPLGGPSARLPAPAIEDPDAPLPLTEE